MRLHRGGSFRRRLARFLGRDEARGDELWRRILHGSGALVLVYYLVPAGFFGVVPKEAVLLAALALAVALDASRLFGGVELPTIRPYEARRPASFLFYALALVLALLLFPEAVATVVVLGTALVDPIAGELRRTVASRAVQLGVPGFVYAVLAVAALVLVGRWPWPVAGALAAAAAAAAVVAERVRYAWVDDDLTMTIVPALLLWAVGVRVLGLPG